MDLNISKIIKAKVTKVWKNSVILTTKENVKCFLNISEVSDYFISDLKQFFKIGDIKEVIVIDVTNTGEYIVSFKRIHPKELRNPFEFRMDDIDTNFDALLDFTNKGLRYGK
ncbi:hypothetical protein [[Mycoplasma] anseris]|uniref:S1 motif domain-containing protein n=1 Tax=[Mycoplasma] anseris TaxID=92400 RepID=A0A2Z4NCN9_9BACT|nr:hypothetical protein [[Mycoplasma] anseris]AWX69331.1 hypothetical protein DP065_00990 [[Mycoplasma] anseris]